MSAATTMILIAGFGDNHGLFKPLLKTKLAQTFNLAAIDLPGFGAPRLRGRTTLQRLAEVVDRYARGINARIVLAHSVASIVASLAAQRPASPIDTIVSLEGNLTADDAYFSGMAAAFANPAEFRTAFLARLAELARSDPNIERYRKAVENADVKALWELGVDAHAFSAAQTPGDVLALTQTVAYFYNPANLSAASRSWLERANVRRLCFPGASHWMCFDQPEMLADRMIEAIATR